MLRNLRNYPALSDLNTSKTDDFTIALIDAVATVGDVLTFYQERIANECFLRTYRERKSAVELSNMVGYHPQPGKASSTYLEFTVEEDIVSKKSGEVVISLGTKAQSIPEQGELPQIFETSETIMAKSEWNSMRPKLTRKQNFKSAIKKRILYFSGIEIRISEGNGLLVSLEGEYFFMIIKEVKINTDYQYTECRISAINDADDIRINILTTKSPHVPSELGEAVGAGRGPERPAANLHPREAGPSVLNEMQFTELANSMGLHIEDVVERNNARARAIELEVDTANDIFIFRVKAKIFGHNAPKWAQLPRENGKPIGFAFCDWDSNEEGGLKCARLSYGSAGWPPYAYPPPPPSREEEMAIPLPYDVDDPTHPNPNLFFSAAKGPHFYLDRNYPNVFKNQFVVLKQFDRIDEVSNRSYQIHRIDEVFDSTLSDFTLTSEVLGLRVFPATEYENEEEAYKIFRKFKKRDCSVYAASEQLGLARVPLDPIEGSLKLGEKEITIDRIVTGLRDNHLISIAGETITSTEDGGKDTTHTENAEIKTVKRTEIVRDPDHPDVKYTKIYLEDGLSNEYKLDTVRINANVVPATHGETIEELIGSGKVSHSILRYELSKYPLTYVTSTGPTDVANTLEIRINDVLWHQSTSLYDVDADTTLNSYVLRTDDTGKTSILIDGKLQLTNAGIENINAKYRVGLGLSGMLKANQITIPVDQPLGVRSVTNPLPPTRGIEEEGRDSIRSNIPKRLLTMDRIISLRDFENFARSNFVSISKALATRIVSKNRELVHLSIVLSNINDDVQEIISDLMSSINTLKDPSINFKIQSFREKRFNIKAKIKVRKHEDFENIKSYILQQLKEKYSIQTRDLAQSLYSSEVIGFIQSLEGVKAVDLDLLYIPYRKENFNLSISEDIEAPVLDLNDILNLNLRAIEELLTSSENNITGPREFPFNLTAIGPERLLNNINDVRVRSSEQEGMVKSIELYYDVQESVCSNCGFFLYHRFGRRGMRLRFTVEISYRSALNGYLVTVNYHVLSPPPADKVIHTYSYYKSWIVTLKQRCKFLKARVARNPPSTNDMIGFDTPDKEETIPAELLVINSDEDGGIIIEEMK